MIEGASGVGCRRALDEGASDCTPGPASDGLIPDPGNVRDMEETEREFSIAESRALMPEVIAKAAEIVRLRADLAELTLGLRTDGSSEIGGLAEAKAYEAQLGEQLGWFTEQGIEVKSFAPLLIDFPSSLDGRSIRLCWLEGEAELGWYHLTELGFAGRRPLP